MIRLARSGWGFAPPDVASATQPLYVAVRPISRPPLHFSTTVPKRTSVASSASRARRAVPSRARRSTGSSTSSAAPLVLGGGAAAVIVAIILASGNKDAPKDVGPVSKPQANVGWGNERVQAVAKWAEMVAKGDRIDLAISTDLDAFQKRFQLGDSRLVSTMSGDERSKLKDEILDALLTKEDTKLLREFTPYNGKLVDAAMADAATGRVALDMQAGAAVRERYVSEGTAEVSFTTRDGRYVVDGFTVTSAPREKVVPKPRTTTRHDTIAKPEAKKIERGGKTFTVFEAEITPLEHLADTPPELRSEIDRLIGELIRTDSLPRERSKVKARLREIGKPAVPRLLTRFNDIKADSQEGIVQLTQIDALLRDMSGRAFGFSPAQQTVLASAKENEDARASALKQWYGWWYYYHDKPLDIAFDKEEEDLPAKPAKGSKK